MVASKLKLAELKAWVHCELNGYGENPVPPYRNVGCTLHVQNPYRGLQPFHIENERVAEKVLNVPFNNPISELEDLLSNRGDGTQDAILLSFNPKTEIELMKGMRPIALTPVRRTSLAQVKSIVDAVRNSILDWSLKLEEQGILGNGLTFTEKDVQKAAKNIEIRIGAIYNSGGRVMLGGDNNGQIGDLLQNTTINQAEIKHFEEILMEYKSADEIKKDSIAKKGLKWVNDHAPALGLIAETLKSIFV